MRKIMKSLTIAMLSFMMIVGLFTPINVQAASYQSISNGEVTKCGSYYVKRTTKAIYSSKNNKSWKKVVSAKSSKWIGYGFSSNGSYIFYADNNTSKKTGTIYRIKITGKSKKKIYSTKHMLNVAYYYGSNILYYSDTNNDKSISMKDKCYVYSMSKKKNYYACRADYNIRSVSTSSVNMCSNYNAYDADEVYNFLGYNITKHQELYRAQADNRSYYDTDTTLYYVECTHGDNNNTYINIQVKAIEKSTGEVTAKTDIVKAYWGEYENIYGEEVSSYNYTLKSSSLLEYQWNAQGSMKTLEF